MRPVGGGQEPHHAVSRIRRAGGPGHEQGATAVDRDALVATVLGEAGADVALSDAYGPPPPDEEEGLPDA